MIALPPIIGDSNSPFAYWGHTPTLFDAPCMLSDDYSKRPGVDWLPYSFLVASPDGVMAKSVKPLCCFTWGYRTDSKKNVELVGPSLKSLDEWGRFIALLQERFPECSFET